MNYMSRHCPFCAEEINENAVKCKHCQSDLQQKTGLQREFWNRDRGCADIFLVVFLIFFAMVVIIFVM